VEEFDGKSSYSNYTPPAVGSEFDLVHHGLSINSFISNGARNLAPTLAPEIMWLRATIGAGLEMTPRALP
jgi:hypothetical protein